MRKIFNEIKILSLSVIINIASEHIKQVPTELGGGGNLMNSQSLRKILTYSQQTEQSKVSKATEDLNDVTNQHDLTNIAQHITIKIYFLSKQTQNYKEISGHKVNLNKYQRISIIQVFSLTIMP